MKMNVKYPIVVLLALTLKWIHASSLPLLTLVFSSCFVLTFYTILLLLSFYFSKWCLLLHGGFSNAFTKDCLIQSSFVETTAQPNINFTVLEKVMIFTLWNKFNDHFHYCFSCYRTFTKKIIPRLKMKYYLPFSR